MKNIQKINRFFLFAMLIFCESTILAQTSGPTQPEVQSFQQADITNMVEISTGTFQYNIPLFTIGGYPVNVNYSGAVGMEQEASMVGLGWNLSCGMVTRSVRGIADDFKGDLVTKKIKMKPNITNSIGLSGSMELIGFDKETVKKVREAMKSNSGTPQASLSVSLGSLLSYNNVRGWSVESSCGVGIAGSSEGLSGNAGIGVNSSSASGFGVNPYFGISFDLKKANDEEENSSTTSNRFNKLNNKLMKSVTPSASISFNNASYTPKIDFPFNTVVLDNTFKINGEVSLAELGAEIRGIHKLQTLQTNLISSPAYGSIYADNGKTDIYGLMDFNREQDGVMTETKPNLPLAFATPDVYSVAGQGIGGSFELKRNNVFIGFDPKAQSNDEFISTEADLGLGKVAHMGAKLNISLISNTSEKWYDNSNGLLDNIDFNDLSSGVSNTSLLENTYLKNPSDVMFSDNSLFATTSFNPIAPILKSAMFIGGKTENLKVLRKYNLFSINPSSFSNIQREHRLDMISYLTAEDAKMFGLVKDIELYTLGSLPTGKTLESRVSGHRKAHHISEFTYIKPDGMRYIFNIPAYNIEKREVSYSVNDNPDAEIQGEIATVPDLNNYMNYSGGKDNYISITETPAYAHSFLLGAMLSANYIDVDDNGPSPNDIGDYVKFNYSRVHSDFYWRTNNDKNVANYEDGAIGNKFDSKANFCEGKKEIWMIHSIETKNEVAMFYYSNRNDAWDMNLTSNTLKRLDSIKLFSRPQLTLPTPATIKKVYFEYDYSLCKGAMDVSTQGKLTLKKVYFKNGTSHKGKLNAYEFAYSNINPDIKTTEMDRWGNYKPLTTPQGNPNTGNLTNKKYPYVAQNNSTNDPLNKANLNSTAWLMNEIKTPTGSKISIEYEAHDYAFVQQKRAMYMAPIESIIDNPNTASLPTVLSTQNELFKTNAPQYDTKDFIVFKLKKTIPNNTPNPNELVEELYFTDRNDTKYGSIIGNTYGNLYGKMRVKLDPSIGIAEEEIPVFLKAIECGALKIGSTDYNYGYVRLAEEKVLGQDVNAISKHTWQFCNAVYPKILFNMSSDPSFGAGLDPMVLGNLFSPGINALKQIINGGPLLSLRKRGIAKDIVLNKSYIRVFEPESDKIGGSSSRVKKITIDDNWNFMSNNTSPSSKYSIHYDYTNKTEDGRTISSGVASYEPEMGGDENPWKQPILYSEKNVMMADKQEFMMTTYGESLFPGANIVYSKVSVTQNDVTGTPYVGTGKTINEFYTYKDFPCYTDETKLQLIRDPKLKIKLQKFVSNDNMLATQGYLVVVNDMHGKPKSEEVYGEKNNLITAKYYKYKNDTKGKLINKVPAVQIDGSISIKDLGIETQITGDCRSFSTKSSSGELKANVDLDGPTPPAIVPSAFPNFSNERKNFKSFSLTTFIRQQGILDTIIAVDKGAQIYTVNKAWDAQTGAVLLTESINEFKDPVFQFTLPAHWAYSGMGMSSDNTHAFKDGLTAISLGSQLASVSHPGDIVGFNVNGIGYKYVVENSTTLRPLYRNSFYTGSGTNIKAKILQSGKRNLATTPIGVYTFNKSPMASGSLQNIDANNIINAEINEYANYSAMKCNSCDSLNANNSNSRVASNAGFGFYLSSTKHIGAWQKLRTLKNINERTQTPNQIIRQEGSITNFKNYWTWGSSKWNPQAALPQWQFTSRLALVNRDLNPIEEKNPLNIYTSVQQSNFNGMVNAIVNNARYHETFCESFEDVADPCDQKHHSVYNGDYSLISPNESHTGDYSMLTTNTGYTKNFAFDSKSMAEQIRDIYHSCEPEFVLKPDNEYIFTAWVKETNSNLNVLNYINAKVDITMGATTYTAKPSGLIVDGWQRIEYKFKTPLAASSVALKFSSNTYFDDIRIFPFNANMKSYVYSDKDYRLMAILDENNFATFYEYDDEKNLKRTKKETDKGVVTIQEVNAGLIKK